MKKKFLSVIGFAILCRFQVYAQVNTDTTRLPKPAYTSLYTPVDQDSSSYNARQLRIDEIDLVSSYYTQTGDRSAVMGGMPGPKGTQNVTDFSNGLNLNLVWLNQANNKNTLSVGLGYDHHSSASAAYVALNGRGNPRGTRIYPSLDWTVENAKTGGTFGIGAYYSGEYNYKSKGIDFHWSVKTNDKSGEFGMKLQGYFDKVTLILPSELIPPTPVSQPGTTYTITTASGVVETLSSGGQLISSSKNSLPTSARTTLTAAFSYSQQINSRLQVMFLGDVVSQSGYLGLPFHRVYFNDSDTSIAKVEKLPSSRFKLPLGFRLNYFLGDNIILRTYYRYYMDNWGTRSNTASIEVPYKVTPFFSISPFYRYYDQTAAKYYAPYREHSPTDAYYTSNIEYAKFNAGFYGVGFRVAPPNGVFGMHSFHEMEIRYGHYTQTTNLASDVVSLSMGFK